MMYVRNDDYIGDCFALTKLISLIHPILLVKVKETF